MKKEKSLVIGVALTDDPVEIHILKFYDRLLNQNNRMKSHRNAPMHDPFKINLFHNISPLNAILYYGF